MSSTLRIAVVSPKGGVGKTTLVANLADALSSQGQSVLAVDLDPQNALAFHLAEDVADANGLGVASLCGRPWSSALRSGTQSSQVLPFGRLADRHRQLLVRRLRDPQRWLERGLESANADLNDVVLMDTPPGGSSLQRAALAVADLVIVTLLADAASVVASGGTRALLAAVSDSGDAAPQVAYLVNRFDTERSLARDVLARYERQYGDALIPQAIHQHPDIEEALAHRRSVVRHQPDGDSAAQFQSVARWLLAQSGEQSSGAGT